MKKIITTIITLSIFFSTNNISFAKEGYIEQILDLNVGIEEYDLALEHIDYIFFRDPNTQALFNEYKNSVALINQEIIRKYANKEFEYYQINGIISNQKQFIYHINKLFYYISIKEEGNNYIETNDLILENYSKARTYYIRLKYLIK